MRGDASVVSIKQLRLPIQRMGLRGNARQARTSLLIRGVVQVTNQSTPCKLLGCYWQKRQARPLLPRVGLVTCTVGLVQLTVFFCVFPISGSPDCSGNLCS